MHEPCRLGRRDVGKGAVTWPRLSALAFAVWCVSPAMADQVLMKNGDCLTGDVIRAEGDRLRLKTGYAGIVELDWNQVLDVKMDEPREALLDDDRVLDVIGVTRENGQLILHQTPGSPPTIVDPARVKVLDPEPWELGKGHRFGGKINLAWKEEEGNSESSELDLDFKLEYRRQWNLVQTYWQFEYDTTRGIQSSDNWTGVNNYSRLFQSPWYASVFLVLKHDRFADLALRYMVGPSLGYRFAESLTRNLRFEAGGYYLDDDFYDQSDERYLGPGWYLDADQSLWKSRLKLYHRQIGFSAADDTGKYIWRSWTGVRVPLTSGFVGSAEYEVDYDSRPAVEAKTTDTTFRLKLGYQW